MIKKFEDYNNTPFRQNDGTHVIVLPNNIYPKKHWNKINYVTIKQRNDIEYYLKDLSVYGNSKKVRLSSVGNYAPVFYGSAKPGIHFN